MWEATLDACAMFGYSNRSVVIGFSAYNFGAITAVMTFADSTDTITLADGWVFSFGTVSGTKFGTSATQKMGFWGAAPVAQPAAIANPTDAASTQARLIDLLNALRSSGLIAT